MISEIKMSGVASFKASTSLQTDKKINLIYGLNGTGKSTLSGFLYKPDEEKYGQCSIDPTSHEPIVVYNESFIRDHFYEADSLKGVFSLSKENKVAKEKILTAERQLDGLQKLHAQTAEEIFIASNNLETKRSKCADDVWVIKTSYCGGDRVLEYCLDGLKGQKDRLLDHLISISIPAIEPQGTISELKAEVEVLRAASAEPIDELPGLACAVQVVESHPLLRKAIVGNADSVVANLIDRLQNSDWVKEGLRYLPEESSGGASLCPFCQERTITKSLIKNIRGYFDDVYEADLSALSELAESIRNTREAMPGVSQYYDHELADGFRDQFERLYGECVQLLQYNLQQLERKLRTPSMVVELQDSKPKINAFNQVVNAANVLIRDYNTKVANMAFSLDAIKTKFWELMRWHYDQTVSRYLSDKKEFGDKIDGLINKKASLDKEMTEQRAIIALAQKETVNIDEAVNSINARLVEIGIDDFSIKKHSDSLYRIVRLNECDDVFHTLSEGERMVISFLYFCELALGRLSAEDTGLHRIAVIDDPISSLSHVHIFNVGVLLKHLFIKSTRFTQVFVLTHSLYFFYELVDAKHDRRKEEQKLFRIVKNSFGSQIKEMKYEEIQNDYHAYWSIINDPNQPPALLANCMRNVIEYFFSFVGKKTLENVFAMPVLQNPKYQAFYRYVNRESHSVGQNLLDLKEFDYDVFLDGLRLVFDNTGFGDHYKVMSKV